MKKQTVDVIIPLYKPGEELFQLLERLMKQTIKPHRIILINTEKKYFDKLLYGNRLFEELSENVDVYHISKQEFDHGKTRDLAVQKSNAEIFVMMTQDAMPHDKYMLDELIKPLKDEQTVVSYGRQLPAKGCNVIEQYAREFNYPDQTIKKTIKDLPKMGIKTYFCSNVCAAYKRDAYDRLGGFIRRTIFNEDMIFAANAIKSGDAIVYAANAKVIHSHNYTGLQQLKRNFDLGVSQADNPEIFYNIPSEKEGKVMVKKTLRYLWKNSYKHMIPGYIFQCACRYLGYILGKHYKKLPKAVIKKCTMSPEYF